mmetsp:Transcript_16121/g.35857  ORF Transcript_16121/g.35857 Transcript_16121/m.35857 type:complete len:294 (-) Transcript_16121:122-1003(-)
MIFRSSYLLLVVGTVAVSAFHPVNTRPLSKVSIMVPPLRSMSPDDFPSDYDGEDLSPTEQSVVVDENEDDDLIRDQLKRELLLMASTTDRGEFATGEERDIVVDLVTQLEALNPTPNPATDCNGDWDLCISSTQLFRSSPFFQSLRSLAGEENKAIAENGFDLHERATSTGQIGRVRQTISDDELVSEVDLTVGILPGIPFRIKGTVVTRAKLTVNPPEEWDVKVIGTSVKASNVPFLDQLLDDVDLELPVGSLYEQLLGKVPVSELKTFYVDEGLRITRDVDDNFYVFTRIW